MRRVDTTWGDGTVAAMVSSSWRPIVFLAWIVGIPLISRCSSLGSLVNKPEVELESFELQDPSLTAATLVFSLRVINPNPFRLLVESLTYDLNLNQKDFAKGQLSESVSISGKDKGVVKLPVRIGYLKLFNSLYEMTEKGTVEYQLKGNVRVSGFEVPFSLGGKLNLPSSVP
jgi:LEA14-like dessication related protein